MNALIGKNVDLATEYDLIIVGAYGKDRMNMGILKNVYSKENSKIQEQGYSNAVKENGETALELNGNDITEIYILEAPAMWIPIQECIVHVWKRSLKILSLIIKELMVI